MEPDEWESPLQATRPETSQQTDTVAKSQGVCRGLSGTFTAVLPRVWSRLVKGLPFLGNFRLAQVLLGFPMDDSRHRDREWLAMLKIILVGLVIAGGLFLGLHESPNGGVAFVNSAEAAVPAPGVLALLGIGGLAIAFRLKRGK